MSRHKHQAPRRKPTPAEEALHFVPTDLDDIARKWPMVLEQLDLRSDKPPRLHEAPTGELLEARNRRDREERDERILNTRRGVVPLDYTAAPLRVAALEDLVIVETALVALGDRITTYVRRGRVDSRPGPHRLTHARPLPAHRPGRRDVDHLGYPLRLDYGMRVQSGRALTDVGRRNDREPVLAAVNWIRAALPAITDVEFAKQVADDVRRARALVRGVAGYPDLQVRLDPACFVCNERSLRMNVDKVYVECRNPACEPTDEQCGFKGPRGEPRWSKGEWGWLSDRLGISLDAQLRSVLQDVEQAS